MQISLILSDQSGDLKPEMDSAPPKTYIYSNISLLLPKLGKILGFLYFLYINNKHFAYK